MEITGLITAIVFGAVIGGLGRLVVPGRHKMSLLVTILVGIVAAVLGTAVAGFIGVADTPGIDWTELALQIVFAGGGVIKLDVECIDAGLSDVGGAWAARGRPDHDGR